MHLATQLMPSISLSAVLNPEDSGSYVALCPELDIASQGESIDDAVPNLKEAIEGFFEIASREEIESRLDARPSATPARQGPAPALHWENLPESLHWNHRPQDGQTDSQSVPGSRERRALAFQNFRVPLNDFLHGSVIAPSAHLCEPKLLPTMEPERISILI